MKPIRTVLYGRVSHDEQAKFGVSIENQIDRLTAYAKENNLLIVDKYIDEGYSAGTTKRPELQRLLADLDKFDLIIFTRLDRFSRNVLDANEMVKLFFRKNVSIRAIEEEINTQTADGMFEFNLRVSLAQRELAKGSERINTVFDYKIKQGHAISGSQPLGYKIEKNQDNIKKVVKDEAVSHIVEDMFQHFMQFQSIRGTMMYINDKYNLNKSYKAYNRMLKNELYAGKLRDNFNYCPAYITLGQYEQIQDMIQKNIKIRKNNYVYLFSGLISCGCCGGSMAGNFATNRNKREYYYYRCSRYHTGVGCDRTTGVNEILIEDYLLKNINRLIEEHIYATTIEIENKPKPKIDVKAITEEMDRLTIAFRKGRMKEPEYDYEYELLEEKLKEVERVTPQETDLTSVQTFINSDWKNLYKSLTKVEKRALFRSVIKDISIDRDCNIEVKFF